MVTVTHEYTSKPIEPVHLNTVPLTVCKSYLNKVKKKKKPLLETREYTKISSYKTHKVNTQKWVASYPMQWKVLAKLLKLNILRNMQEV